MIYFPLVPLLGKFIRFSNASDYMCKSILLSDITLVLDDLEDSSFRTKSFSKKFAETRKFITQIAQKSITSLEQGHLYSTNIELILIGWLEEL